MPACHNIAVIGANRHRQGTGAFIASGFAGLGHKICAIVGTSEDSLARASRNLRLNYGIRANTYTDVATLFDQEDIDILAIASPNASHLKYLYAAARVHCHAFCEKPLWWAADDIRLAADKVERTATDLVGLFDDCRRSLHVNLQWPHTLTSFQALYPNATLAKQHIKHFEMRLGPESSGTQMVVDSAPHLLSMLYHLLGIGHILNGAARYRDAERTALTLTFDYHHGRDNVTAVTLTLKRHPGQPKPAGYSINGNSVERKVTMPGYLLSFTAQDQSMPIQDPLLQSIETFLDAIRREQPNQKQAIVAGMKHLHQLARLCEQTDRA